MTLPIHSNLPGVNEAMTRSREAFQQYKKSKPAERFQLMAAIASELEGHAQELVDLAAKETFLDRSRLQTELKRTCLQMLSYGQACAKGLSLDIRIQYADPGCQPPRQDLRKMRVPLGPVVVFGASNFPFAYSTAGGDTACALAAGCTVVVKAHPAHPNTSSRVAELINRAVLKSGWDPGIFIHMHGDGFATGQALVMHPFTSAVAFTGSLEGGRALFDLANQRAVPIPVFAEMGSVNPVFILPGKLEQEMKSLTDMLAASITNSAGQFCTNPGLLIAIENDSLKEFEKGLGIKLKEKIPQKMLHEGIARSFHEKRRQALEQQGVNLIAMGEEVAGEDHCMVTLAGVSAEIFLENPLLHEEVFGAFSLLVRCRDQNQMLQVASSMNGQLTATLLATEEEVAVVPELVEVLSGFCGRLILNGVPTGVEVSTAMHHGGPYPASTDSRFTAVGADGIQRFSRPLCFQNWPSSLLPAELHDSNPLQLYRIVIDEPANCFIN